MGSGSNAFLGNGQFTMIVNISLPNSGLACLGATNNISISNGALSTQSFGPFRCISSGYLTINGTGIIEDNDIFCTGEPLECSGTGEFEIIGTGNFEIVAIPELTCTRTGEFSTFDLGERFMSRGSFACNVSTFFTLNGTGEIESVTTVSGDHNCYRTNKLITSGNGMIDVVTCSGEGYYVIIGDGNFYINQTGPGMLHCSGEITAGVNISQTAEYLTNGEFSCIVSGIVYFTGIGRAEVINSSASYECNGVLLSGSTVEPPFSGFGSDRIECFTCGESVNIVGSGQIQMIAISSTSINCQGAVSSDLDQNKIVSTGDFMCTGNGLIQITGRGEVFVNSTAGFSNCTHDDTMVSDSLLLCSDFGEY